MLAVGLHIPIRSRGSNPVSSLLSRIYRRFKAPVHERHSAQPIDLVVGHAGPPALKVGQASKLGRSRRPAGWTGPHVPGLDCKCRGIEI